MQEVKTKLASVMQKEDCYKHRTAVEMYDLFKNTITDIIEDTGKKEETKSYFVRTEEASKSEIDESPVIEHVVNLVKAEDNPDETIQDCGAPKSVGGIDYVGKYLKILNLCLDEMPRVKT